MQVGYAALLIPQNKNCTSSKPYSKKKHEKAFGAEAQQFFDKTIYAKMKNHVKKIFNRDFLEEEAFNDKVLHLEKSCGLTD